MGSGACSSEGPSSGFAALDPGTLDPRIVAPEIAPKPDGEWIPLFLSQREQIQLCMTVDPRWDTGQWHLE